MAEQNHCRTCGALDVTPMTAPWCHTCYRDGATWSSEVEEDYEPDPDPSNEDDLGDWDELV